jgi:hypothetical protein
LTLKRPPLWILGLFVLSLAMVNPYVRGDGNGYYAWLVSPVIDGDLDFTNQYRHADPLFKTLMFAPDGQPQPVMISSTGHLGNQWSVGPAVLWAPWFLAAHAGVQIARALGATLPADGYSWPYVWASAIGTAVYGACAVWFGWLAATAAGFGKSAGASALVLWAASPLPVYQYFLPFHVHALAAFGCAAFLAYWLRQRPLESVRQWMTWGALAGLMAMIYQLNSVLLLVAVWELWARFRRRGFGAAGVAGAVFALAGLTVMLPHWIGKFVVYGHPLRTGYGDRFFFSSPRLLEAAFSTEHGVFTWTPIALAAALGLVLAARRRAPVAAMAVAAAVFFYFVASYQNWHGQSSFGNRFFVSLFGIAVVGLAAVIAPLMERTARNPGTRAVVIAAALFLVAWNAGLAVQWGLNIIPNRGPVDFAVVARNQVTEVPRVLSLTLVRYFRDRGAVVRDVEERDSVEPRSYRLIR